MVRIFVKDVEWARYSSCEGQRVTTSRWGRRPADGRHSRSSHVLSRVDEDIMWSCELVFSRFLLHELHELSGVKITNFFAVNYLYTTWSSKRCLTWESKTEVKKGKTHFIIWLVYKWTNRISSHRLHERLGFSHKAFLIPSSVRCWIQYRNTPWKTQ